MPPSLQGLLDAHAPADAAEALSLAEMRQLLPRLDQPLSRHQSKAHFTASALVVDVEAVNIALLHHAKLRRWLQPGGHAEPGDGGLMHATALREARGDEPAHHHLDLRFLMVAEDPQRLTLNADESSAVGGGSSNPVTAPTSRVVSVPWHVAR